MRFTLALWSKAGTSAYKEFQKSTFSCFPSIRHMQLIKSALAVKDGYDPQIYKSFFDNNLHNNQDNSLIPARLMFDEMKLKSGITFNCKDGSMTGFVTDNDGFYSISNATRFLFKELQSNGTSNLPKKYKEKNRTCTEEESTLSASKSEKKLMKKRAMSFI